jgi:acylphosphatase
MTRDIQAVHVLVKGRVQGVGFRFFTQELAENYGLKGWVRNLPGGDVECEAEGPRSELESFIEVLRKGPPVARVDDLQIDWRPAISRFPDFSIR